MPQLCSLRERQVEAKHSRGCPGTLLFEQDFLPVQLEGGKDGGIRTWSGPVLLSLRLLPFLQQVPGLV